MAQKDPDRRDWVQLFNGRDLDDWPIKFARPRSRARTCNDTFRVEDGLLKVRYDKWPTFNGEFGHIFYREPFSYYLLAAEYRFVGEQVTSGPSGLGWAVRNNGLMLHSPRSEDDAEGSGFPDLDRGPAAGRAGRRQAADDGESLHAGHARRDERQAAHARTARTRRRRRTTAISGSASRCWCTATSVIRHMVEGATVLEYQKPQIGGGSASADRSRR